MMPKRIFHRRRPRFRYFVVLRTETIPPPPRNRKKQWRSVKSSNFGSFGFGRYTLYIGSFFSIKLGAVDDSRLVHSVLCDCRYGFIRYTLSYFAQE